MTAAELAVGIAGFTAIAIALGRVGVENARDRLDIFVLLSVPLCALTFSLLPVVLVYLNASPSIALRFSSGVMVVVTVAWYAYAYTRPDVELRAESALSVRTALVTAANTLAQLANAALLSDEWHFGVYFAGVAWVLVTSVSGLLLVIQARSAT